MLGRVNEDTMTSKMRLAAYRVIDRLDLYALYIEYACELNF